MFKHKKILFVGSLIAMCSLFSCTKANEKYKVAKYSEGTSFPLKVVVPDRFKKDYEVSGKDDVLLDVGNLEVSYNDKALTWDANIEKENNFFLCTNDSYPTNSVVKGLKITSSAERSDLNFFVAYIDLHLEQATTFVSQRITVHVTNSGAIKPWVWFVITGVVIFGVVGMVFYTKRRKENR